MSNGRVDALGRPIRKRSGKRDYRNAWRWRVHMKVPWGSAGGYAAACGNIGSGYQLTEDTDDVTCKLCRKAMAREVEEKLGHRECNHRNPGVDAKSTLDTFTSTRDGRTGFVCTICRRVRKHPDP